MTVSTFQLDDIALEVVDELHANEKLHDGYPYTYAFALMSLNILNNHEARALLQAMVERGQIIEHPTELGLYRAALDIAS